MASRFMAASLSSDIELLHTTTVSRRVALVTCPPVLPFGDGLMHWWTHATSATRGWPGQLLSGRRSLKRRPSDQRWTEDDQILDDLSSFRDRDNTLVGPGHPQTSLG